MSKRKPILRGPARMRELGQKSVTVWFDDSEIAFIDKARVWRKRSAYIRALVRAHAEKTVTGQLQIDRAKRGQ